MYNSIFEQVSQELNLPSEVVKKAYYSFYEFMREHIKALPLKDNISKEEFDKLRTNFNLPSLGKLSCTYTRMVGVNERFKYIRKLREDIKSNGH